MEWVVTYDVEEGLAARAAAIAVATAVAMVLGKVVDVSGGETSLDDFIFTFMSAGFTFVRRRRFFLGLIVLVLLLRWHRRYYVVDVGSDRLL